MQTIGLAALLAMAATADFDARYARLKAEGVVMIEAPVPDRAALSRAGTASASARAPGPIRPQDLPGSVRRQLASAPALAGCPRDPVPHRAIVDLAILPQGRLEAVAVAVRPADPALLRCIKTALRSMRFPGYAAPGDARSVEVVNVSVALQVAPLAKP